MTGRQKLDRQIVVRVTPEMHQALQADADANGRTLAQTWRHLIRRAIEPQGTARWGTAAVVDSRRATVADRHATLVYGLRDIHSERDGFCDGCWTRYPCPTIRLVNELAADQ